MNECPAYIILDTMHCDRKPGHKGDHVIRGMSSGDLIWKPDEQYHSVSVRDLTKALRATYDLGHGHANLGDDEPCYDCTTEARELLALTDRMEPE